MFSLVAHQLFLRSLYFHLKVNKLLGKPVGGLHCRFELRLKVLLDIRRREGIDSARGQLRIGAVVMNLHDSGVGNQRDLKTSSKRRQQRRGAVRITLQWVSDEISLFLIGVSAKLGPLIQV